MRIIIEEIKKNFKIMLSYPIEIFFWIVFPLLWVLPLIFQGKAMVGGLRSSSFGNLSGTEEFIPYVLIGAIFSTYMFSAVWGMGSSFRDEMYFGTLEFILSSPTPQYILLFAKAIYNTLLSTIFVIFQVLVCVIFFGLHISLFKIAPFLIILLLLLIGLYGIGFFAAALTLLVKESHGLLHLFEYVLFLFSPIRYPVEVNPVTRAVSLFIPLTYALIVIRGILLNLEFNFLRNSIMLLIIDMIILLLSIFTYAMIERSTRKKGTLAYY